MKADLVVFRKWRDNGGVIALFPELPADIDGHFCQSYEHVGQHAAADYLAVINHTCPVTPQEYAALADELVRIGYRLMPRMQASRRHHERRRLLASMA